VRFVDLCASAILPTTGFKIRKKAPVLAGSVCMGEVGKNAVHDSDSIVVVCILRLQIFVKMVLKNLRKNRISKNILKFSSAFDYTAQRRTGHAKGAFFCPVKRLRAAALPVNVCDVDMNVCVGRYAARAQKAQKFLPAILIPKMPTRRTIFLTRYIRLIK
jgi:hypothetical protein